MSTWKDPIVGKGETMRRGLNFWRTERIINSVNGNPRFKIWFRDDTTVWFKTSSDASAAYDIGNLVTLGAAVDIVLTRGGRIIYIRPTRCAVCNGLLELSEQEPDAGLIHRKESDDWHAPVVDPVPSGTEYKLEVR